MSSEQRGEISVYFFQIIVPIPLFLDPQTQRKIVFPHRTHSFWTGRSQELSLENPKRGRKKTTSCRVRQEAAPDTDFGASTMVG